MTVQTSWKVGELARRTGVSVRTLHYYDEIGLLNPSEHTASGHRLYGEADIARLQQIMSLRRLGLSLAEVRDFISRPDYSAREVLRMHAARLQEQIEAQDRLRRRLDAVAGRLDAKEHVSVEELCQVIKEIEMVEKFEKYYTQEQLDYLAKRREVVGEERIRQVQDEWKELIAEVRARMAEGADPASEPMKKLARRWRGLIDEFTGGDKGVEQSLRNMYRQEPNIAAEHGYTFDPQLADFIGRAIAASET